MAPENSMFEAQLAIMSDQTNRAMRELEKLEEKIDRLDQKVEDKLSYTGDKIHKLSNIITRMEAESKSNVKWVGWALALVIAAGDVVLKVILG
jgi:flagellar capping protein FliD|tara:strand:- start:2587 stop:2865 length:279 start_codon:yes stop_codon:yes gene_type:complete